MADDIESEYTGADDDVEEEEEDIEVDIEEEKIPRKLVRKIIVCTERQTSDRLTLAEQTELISIRCAQLQHNPTVMPGVDITGLTDPVDIAKREFNMRKCPLKIRRSLGFREIDGELVEYVEDIDPKHPDCIFAKIYDV